MATNFQFWADVVVFLHAAFVFFVLFGGLAVLRWRRLAWFHIPAALWGTAIEAGGWPCPLTYLENYFRRLGGGTGYGGTFIERYLVPIVYPPGLTRQTQILFALAALLLNLAIYARIWSRGRKIRIRR